MDTTLNASLQLPATTAAPAMARRLVRTACEGLPRDVADVAALLTSELVTDAVLRRRLDESGPELAIGLRIQHTPWSLRVEVRDPAGQPAPSRTNPPTDAIGQLIVAELASQWGSRRMAPRGTAVWFELKRRRPSMGAAAVRRVGRPPVDSSARRASPGRVPQQRAGK